MTRILFTVSGGDKIAPMMQAAADAARGPFSFAVFDSGTDEDSRRVALASAGQFGETNIAGKRVEWVANQTKAEAAALEWAAALFPFDKIEIFRADASPTWSNPGSETARAMRSNKVESFCTVATENFSGELMLLIRSIRGRSRKPIYVAGDDAICDTLNTAKMENVHAFRIATRGRLEWIHAQNFAAERHADWPRDEYPHCPPACMVKMDIAQRALELSDNTLYLDADFIITGSLNETIPADIDCAFSPSWHSPKWKDAAANFGRYNAGSVFIRAARFPEWWRSAALHRSKFMDQQCLDLAAREGFKTADLGPEHNFGFWRIWSESEELKGTKKTGEELADLLGFSQGKKGIELNGKPLVSFHVQMFHDTPGHAPLQRMVKHLLSESLNPLQRALL
mgnify:FL=1